MFTEINRVSIEEPQTLGAGHLAILAGAVNLVAFASFDKPELAREEDLITLSGTFEPFANKLFIVTVETMSTVSAHFYLHTIL